MDSFSGKQIPEYAIMTLAFEYHILEVLMSVEYSMLDVLASLLQTPILTQWWGLGEADVLL